MNVEMGCAGRLVGKYIILWRNDSNQLARVIWVDEDKHKIGYKLVTGSDKGKKCGSLYDSVQTVKAFTKKKEALRNIEERDREKKEMDEKIRRMRLKTDIERAMDILKDCLTRI